jgi:hypothetical protein
MFHKLARTLLIFWLQCKMLFSRAFNPFVHKLANQVSKVRWDGEISQLAKILCDHHANL